MNWRERRAFRKEVYGPPYRYDVAAARRRSAAAAAARVLARAMGMDSAQIDRAGSYGADCNDPIEACRRVQAGEVL